MSTLHHWMRQGLITRRGELCRAGFRQKTGALLPQGFPPHQLCIQQFIPRAQCWYFNLAHQGIFLWCWICLVKGPVRWLRTLVSLSSAGVGRVMALGDLMGCASLYTPGFSPLQFQRVEDAHKAHWADLTAFPQQMSHKLRKGRTWNTHLLQCVFRGEEVTTPFAHCTRAVWAGHHVPAALCEGDLHFCEGESSLTVYSL